MIPRTTNYIRNRPLLRTVLCIHCGETTKIVRKKCSTPSNPIYLACPYCGRGITKADIEKQIDAVITGDAV